jgi:hypothetical protein
MIFDMTALPTINTSRKIGFWHGMLTGEMA